MTSTATNPTSAKAISEEYKLPRDLQRRIAQVKAEYRKRKLTIVCGNHGAQPIESRGIDRFVIILKCGCEWDLTTCRPEYQENHKGRD